MWVLWEHIHMQEQYAQASEKKREMLCQTDERYLAGPRQGNWCAFDHVRPEKCNGGLDYEGEGVELESNRTLFLNYTVYS